MKEDSKVIKIGHEKMIAIIHQSWNYQKISLCTQMFWVISYRLQYVKHILEGLINVILFLCICGFVLLNF